MVITCVTILAGILGLILGSFANVLIHRIPRRESIVSPGSHCPHCDAPIRWFQNIPVLSWVVLLGRCASCRGPISPRYPLVEALMGATFSASAYAFFPSAADTAGGCLFCFLAVVLGLIDLEHQILPDVLTYPGMAAGFAFSFFVSWTDWKSALAGALLGGGLIMALLLFWEKVIGVDGMGWGDVKYLALIGAFLGWKGTLITLILGAFLGSVVGGGILLVSRRRLFGTALPFGTFLAAASLASLFFHEAIWFWYMGFYPPNMR